MTDKHYDLIIIGGRCAGASLASRLADNNLNILLLDRATFPSFPAVPSAPFIHPGTMQLLDEIGIEESAYSREGSKIEHFVVDFGKGSSVGVPMSRLMLDRNHFRGVDRQYFDNALWEYAAKQPGVTAQTGFAVTKIDKDENGTVKGISGKNSDGTETSFTADLVVGADGRFSFAAGKFGAQTTEEHNKYTSSTYFAEWKNVPDYSPEFPNAVNTYNTGKGLMILMIPVAKETYHIAVAMRTGHPIMETGNTEEGYEAGLQLFPALWERLSHATRTSKIFGMRPIKNGYREAAGAGWALVGDAVHYKDPSDGQGIYDALLTSKLLAKSILDWKKGGISWASAGEQYQAAMLGATRPTFLQTMKNLRNTFYVNSPGFVMRKVGRWMLSDEDAQTQFLRYLSRAIPPEEFNLGISPKIIINGLRGKYS